MGSDIILVVNNIGRARKRNNNNVGKEPRRVRNMYKCMHK